METSTVAILIICSIINWVITYAIISGASRSQERNEILFFQTRLLCQLLMQSGMTREQLKELADQAKDNNFKPHFDDYRNIIPGMDKLGNIEKK
ncbi:MAG: hypothetical protein QM764_22070 [Chitinophagaceae bacterium]